MPTLLQQNQNSTLRSILWGLLLTKCFALEYFAIKHAVPINTTVYVWALSISMAAVATLVHLKLKVEETGTTEKLSPIHLLWILATTLTIAVLFAHYQLNEISQKSSLATTAAIMGGSCIAQGLILSQLKYAAIGFGWWIGAAMLFRTDSPGNYLIFSACLFILWVTPSIVVFLLRRRAQ